MVVGIESGDGQAKYPISFEQFSGAYTEIANLIWELTISPMIIIGSDGRSECKVEKLIESDRHNLKPGIYKSLHPNLCCSILNLLWLCICVFFFSYSSQQVCWSSTNYTLVRVAMYTYVTWLHVYISLIFWLFKPESQATGLVWGIEDLFCQFNSTSFFISSRWSDCDHLILAIFTLQSDLTVGSTMVT